jgi:hypothetical protein
MAFGALTSRNPHVTLFTIIRKRTILTILCRAMASSTGVKLVACFFVPVISVLLDTWRVTSSRLSCGACRTHNRMRSGEDSTQSHASGADVSAYLSYRLLLVLCLYFTHTESALIPPPPPPPPPSTPPQWRHRCCPASASSLLHLQRLVTRCHAPCRAG